MCLILKAEYFMGVGEERGNRFTTQLKIGLSSEEDLRRKESGCH